MAAQLAEFHQALLDGVKAIDSKYRAAIEARDALECRRIAGELKKFNVAIMSEERLANPQWFDVDGNPVGPESQSA